jgi:hypothetical protein
MVYRTTRYFFGIGYSFRELIPDMKSFWPEAKGRIHVDAWREVTIFDNFSIIDKILIPVIFQAFKLKI